MWPWNPHLQPRTWDTWSSKEWPTSSSRDLGMLEFWGLLLFLFWSVCHLGALYMISLVATLLPDSQLISTRNISEGIGVMLCEIHDPWCIQLSAVQMTGWQACLECMGLFLQISVVFTEIPLPPKSRRQRAPFCCSNLVHPHPRKCVCFWSLHLEDTAHYRRTTERAKGISFLRGRTGKLGLFTSH